MNELIYPPSPNWYLANVFACNEGVLCYGTRNCLVIIKTKPENPHGALPEVHIIPNAHKERVTAVAFSTYKDKSRKLYGCIASSGDDAFVKVWDIDTLSPLLANVSHGQDSKVVCMDWSCANPDMIVSLDDSNNLVCWDLPSNSTHTLNVGKLSGCVLTCCPHEKDLVAVGCRSGLVCIVSVKGNGKVLQRMRGHDSEVVSLAWCPAPYNVMQMHGNKSENQAGKVNRDLLLASAAKEKNIFVWRAGFDGRYEFVVSIPVSLTTEKKQGKSALTDMQWVSLCWPEPRTLVSSTRTGRVISWDLRLHSASRAAKMKGGGDSNSTQSWRLLHSTHSRIIFNIVCSNTRYENEPPPEELWRQPEASKPMTLWTSSQDRLIVAYDLQSGRQLNSIPTIGGIVYCIAASPIDPNRIAFGVGDAMIRVWNLSSNSPYDVTLLWQKIRGKVTSIAWHPTQESRLAFGTAEGRVGIFDLSNVNRPALVMHPYHTKCLYSVVWGPALFDCGEEESTYETPYALYSCGDGHIVQYNINNPDAEAKNLNDLPGLATAEKKSVVRTDLSWKPDNSVLAIGNEDGTVQLLAVPGGSILYTLYPHKTLLQSMAWHPEGTATDTGYSPCRHWLAVASKKSSIKVYDLSSLLEDEPSPTALDCIAMFHQHKHSVVGLAWSPHISGQLVSVSFDETAQVWDAVRQIPLGNYSLHAGVLHSCCWSPLDPDLVITGSADCTMRVWRISTLTNVLPVEKKKESKGKKGKVSVSNAEPVEKASPVCEDGVGRRLLVENLPVAAREVDLPSQLQRRRQTRSFFPHWAQMWQGSHSNILDRCQVYLDNLTPLGSEAAPDHEPASSSDSTSKSEAVGASATSDFNSGAATATDVDPDSAPPPTIAHSGNTPEPEANLLGDRASVIQLLKVEESHHHQAGNREHAQTLALWRGDITQTLKDAAQKKQLTDWLVSLAPMASQRLWLEMCRTYAEQLVQEGSFHKAASYLLASHQVEEAIELLAQHHLYREALSLARCRLPADDPTAETILRTWAQRQVSDGHYERAAECLLSVGDLVGAAEVLGRRSDARPLWFAARLARRAQVPSMAANLAHNCLLQCLLHRSWELAMSVIAEFTFMEHYSIVVLTHRTVIELLISRRVLEQPVIDWLADEYRKQHNKEPSESYEALEKSLERNAAPETKSRLWLAVSEDLSLACCAPALAPRLRHLVHALALCYQFQLLRPALFPLLTVLRWLAPNGLLSAGSIFCIQAESEEVAFLLRSLKAYLFAGCFSWLEYELTQPPRVVSPELETEAVTENLSDTSSLKSVEVNGKCSEILETNEHIAILQMYAKELHLEAPSVVYMQVQVKVKKCEQEVANLVAQSHQSTAENASATQGEDPGEESAMLLGLQKLDNLKERKETFEKQRESVPNPFITHCHFRNICEHLKEKDKDIITAITEDADKSWKEMMETLKKE